MNFVAGLSFLAIDLGAESGRAIVGRIDDRLTMDEIQPGSNYRGILSFLPCFVSLSLKRNNRHELFQSFKWRAAHRFGGTPTARRGVADRIF